MMSAPGVAPDPEYLPMGERDLDAVAALEASVQAFPWSRGNFSDALSAGYSTWLCRVGGDLVGFSVVMQVVDEAHLLNIAVCKHYQGQGYGARLLHRAMQNARASGANNMFLEVRRSNDQAARLYRDFGFAEIAVRKGYYPAVTGREDALIFERAL